MGGSRGPRGKTPQLRSRALAGAFGRACSRGPHGLEKRVTHRPSTPRFLPCRKPSSAVRKNAPECGGGGDDTSWRRRSGTPGTLGIWLRTARRVQRLGPPRASLRGLAEKCSTQEGCPGSVPEPRREALLRGVFAPNSPLGWDWGPGASPGRTYCLVTVSGSPRMRSGPLSPWAESY